MQRKGKRSDQIPCLINNKEDPQTKKCKRKDSDEKTKIPL